jgi:hypothetical protein
MDRVIPVPLFFSPTRPLSANKKEVSSWRAPLCSFVTSGNTTGHSVVFSYPQTGVQYILKKVTMKEKSRVEAIEQYLVKKFGCSLLIANCVTNEILDYIDFDKEL